MTTQVQLRRRRNELKVKTKGVPRVYINLNVAAWGSAGWSVEFKRWMSYQVEGKTIGCTATTWSTGGILTGTTRDHIMRIVLDEVDELSNKILSVQVESAAKREVKSTEKRVKFINGRRVWESTSTVAVSFHRPPIN